MKAVQPKAAEPGSGATSSFFKKGGEASLNNETPFFTKGNAVQTKLTVGQPNDQFEQEADSVADQVVQRMAEPDSIQTKPILDANNITPFVQTKCSDCEKEEKLQKKEEEKEQLTTPDLMTKSAMGETLPPPPPVDDDEKMTNKRVQRKCTDCEKEETVQKKGDASSVSPALENSITASKGGGSPLPDGIRTSMESSMGADFSNVRVHTNSNAAGMSSQLGAQAFTHGNDIYFNSGKYNPNNTTGRHLLAHELTHTVQQGSAKPSGIHARMLRLKQDTLQLQAQLAANAEMLMAKPEAPNVQTGILGSIADFATSSLGSLADLLGIELPSGPLEAIRMIVEAAERHPTIVRTVPGLSSVIMILKSVLVIADLIQEIIDHKEEIIAEVKAYLNDCIAKAPEYILASMGNVPGMDPNHLYILWTYYFAPAIDKLISTDWWDVIKDLIWQQIWPFQGITTFTEPNAEDRKGFGADLFDLWTHVKKLLKAVAGLHISDAIDEGLFVQRSLNTIAGRFYGWVAMIIIASEAIAGAIATSPGGPTALAGFAAGAGAGAATADFIGMGLLGISAGTEAAILLKSILSLNPVHETINNEDKAHQNQDYYTQITQSIVSLGIMGAFAALAWLGGKVASAIMSKLVQFLPKGFQSFIEEFLTAYRARQAALMGRTATPEPNAGSNKGGGSGTGGEGSTGEKPKLELVVDNTKGQSGGTGSSGGKESSPVSNGSGSTGEKAKFTVIDGQGNGTGSGSTGEKPNLTVINGEGGGASGGNELPKPVSGGGGTGEAPKSNVIPITRAKGGGSAGGSNVGGGRVGGGGGGGGDFNGTGALQREVALSPEMDKAVKLKLVPKVEPVPVEVPQPVVEPAPLPAVKPEPVSPPVAGTSPKKGMTPGTGIGTGIGTDAATKTKKKQKEKEEDDDNESIYTWALNNKKGTYYLTYPGKEKPGVDYDQHLHHVWPKVLGGMEDQTCLRVINTIHTKEFHYGRSPVGSPVPYILGTIYAFLTEAINNDSEFGNKTGQKNVLKGRKLTHTGKSGSGNRLLINFMKMGTAESDRLKDLVRDTLTEFYLVYSMFSDPVMPFSAYRQGLDDSYNDL